MNHSKENIEVMNLAKLARIAIDKEDLSSYALQLERILDFFNSIENFSLPQTQETVLTLNDLKKNESNFFREDVIVSEPGLHSQIIEQSPVQAGQHYVVPRMIDYD